jgi:adenosylcobinamide-GDP ribazoletransferase
MKALRKLLLAASCVTALPLARSDKPIEDLSGLTGYLPAVGLLIGVLLECIVFLCNWLQVPHLVTGALLTLSWLALSGGIHLDGLMDTADGIFSHRSRERMLEIMHDSRVGNFGVMSGVAVLLIKFAALSSAPYVLLHLAVIVIPVWARWAECFAIGNFSYAREQGMGKVWHDTTKVPRDIILATLLPLLLTAAGCAFFYWQLPVAITLATALAGVLAAYRIAAIVGGHTGDTYGAIVELSEAAGLLFCSVLLPQWRI